MSKVKEYGNYKPLQAEDFLEYPELHKMLTKNRQRLLTYLNMFAEELLPTNKHRHGYNTVRYLVKTKGKSTGIWQSYKSLLCFLRLIKRIPPPNDKQQEKCEEYKKKNPTHAEIAYYQQPRYCRDLLLLANERAQMWLDSGMTIRSISKSSLIENFGLDIALEAYPDARMDTDPYFQKAYNAIHNAIEALLAKQGYATKESILMKAKQISPNVSKTKLTSTYNAIIHLLADEMRLRQPHRATKEEKNLYGLKKYKTIITST